jgi:hypothetical protein
MNDQTDGGVYLPDADEIAARAAEIRGTWTERMARNRLRVDWRSDQPAEMPVSHVDETKLARDWR